MVEAVHSDTTDHYMHSLEELPALPLVSNRADSWTPSPKWVRASGMIRADQLVVSLEDRPLPLITIMIVHITKTMLIKSQKTALIH